MEWEHKGIRFHIDSEPMGAFVMASARAPQEGMFVRVRPFSALGRDEKQAVQLLQQQIELEYRRIPSPVASSFRAKC
ncbi:MAG: hypothetical protein V3T83_00815 [Acidobacteriota bacterium]